MAREKYDKNRTPKPRDQPSVTKEEAAKKKAAFYEEWDRIQERRDRFLGENHGRRDEPVNLDRAKRKKLDTVTSSKTSAETAKSTKTVLQKVKNKVSRAKEALKDINVSPMKLRSSRAKANKDASPDVASVQSPAQSQPQPQHRAPPEAQPEAPASHEYPETAMRNIVDDENNDNPQEQQPQAQSEALASHGYREEPAMRKMVIDENYDDDSDDNAAPSQTVTADDAHENTSLLETSISTVGDSLFSQNVDPTPDTTLDDAAVVETQSPTNPVALPSTSADADDSNSDSVHRTIGTKMRGTKRKASAMKGEPASPQATAYKPRKKKAANQKPSVTTNTTKNGTVAQKEPTNPHEDGQPDVDSDGDTNMNTDNEPDVVEESGVKMSYPKNLKRKGRIIPRDDPILTSAIKAGPEIYDSDAEADPIPSSIKAQDLFLPVKWGPEATSYDNFTATRPYGLLPGRFIKLADGTIFDQKRLLIVKVVDKDTGAPTIYTHNPPKDWHDVATLKRINNRINQQFRRATGEKQRAPITPYTAEERQWILQALLRDPKIVKTKLRTSFNEEFEGKVLASGSGPRPNRSLASVTKEVERHRALYEAGILPKERREMSGEEKRRADVLGAALAERKRREGEEGKGKGKKGPAGPDARKERKRGVRKARSGGEGAGASGDVVMQEELV